MEGDQDESRTKDLISICRLVLDLLDLRVVKATVKANVP